MSKILPIEVISNEELLKNYLTPQMENYFYKKLKTENKKYIQLKICELLKFLTISHHVYGDIPFNDEIDEVWHLWILQTIQYQNLISQLPEKKFINHSSNDYEDETTRQLETDEEKLNNQVSYLVSYVANFGYFTNETLKFWPMVNQLMNILNLDLEGINDYLENLVYDKP